MINNVWTKRFLVIFVAAFASPCFAQDQDTDVIDSQIGERQAVIDLLTNSLVELTPDETNEAMVLERALRFIQQAKSNPRSELRIWNSPRTAPALRDYHQAYKTVKDVHAYLADQVSPSPFWIGVQCEPAVEYQLTLEGDNRVTGKGGLRVTTITKNSPAEAANLKVDDIILSFGSINTDELGQLVAALTKNASAMAEMSLVRDGQFMTLEISPKPRATETDLSSPRDKLDDAFVELYGSTLSDEVEATVVFNQHGVKEITFRKGKNVSNAATEEIDKLPVEYRGIAQQTVWHIDSLLKPQPQTTEKYWEYEPAKKQYHRYSVDFLAQDNEKGTTDRRLETIEMQIQELTRIVLELKKD